MARALRAPPELSCRFNERVHFPLWRTEISHDRAAGCHWQSLSTALRLFLQSARQERAIAETAATNSTAYLHADEDMEGDSLGPRGWVQEAIPPANPHHGPLRVAAIYAGRWLGPEGSSKTVSDHLVNFIRPNLVEVFVAIDPTSWCAAPKKARRAYLAGDVATAEAVLTQQAVALFEHWPRLHVALVPAEDPSPPHDYGLQAKKAMKAATGKTSPGRVAVFMHRWYMQFDHVAKAELFRRAYGPHDVVVRLRLDVALRLPLALQAVARERIQLVCNGTRQVMSFRRDPPLQDAIDDESHAAAHPNRGHGGLELGTYGYHVLRPKDSADWTSAHMTRCLPTGETSGFVTDGHTIKQCPTDSEWVRWMWSDWMQLSTPRAMAALAGMTSDGRVFYTNSTTVRCYGLCPEEQTAYHLEARGVRLLRMGLPLQMERADAIPCGMAPLLNASEMERLHRISPWYISCPSRHGKHCGLG